MAMNEPKEFQILSDRDGFYIADEYGEDLTPTWRSRTFPAARRKLDDIMNEQGLAAGEKL
jgi:hypothetical protein